MIENDPRPNSEEAVTAIAEIGSDEDYTPLDWQRDVTELLRMYLRWNPDESSLQMCLHRVVEQSNRAQLLNKKAAAALSVARHHVRGNINRSGSAWAKENWGPDEKLILDTYDDLIGYIET